MKEFRVDLHLHTCLSPCGSLEMSPQRIVETALERGLDAIAVTDHNSTLQCPEILALGDIFYIRPRNHIWEYHSFGGFSFLSLTVFPRLSSAGTHITAPLSNVTILSHSI